MRTNGKIMSHTIGRKRKGHVLCAFVLMDCLLLTGCAGKQETVFLDGRYEEGVVQTQTSCQGEAGLNASDVDHEGWTQQEHSCFIHVCGAVENPGVYELPAGSRIYEAVDAAGGFTQEASADFVNLAQVIADGDKIVIPTTDQEKQAAFAPAGVIHETAQQENDGKVNINTATKDQLCTLPGIGSSRAESIISYREEKGQFRSIEDIMNVTGIKEGAFEKIKDFIVVG